MDWFKWLYKGTEQNEWKPNVVELYETARAQMLLDHNNDALRTIKNALSREPNGTQLHALAGSIYIKLENYSAAITAFNKVKKLNPSEFAAYLGLGDAYRGKEQFKSSLKSYTKAIRLDSQHHGVAMAWLGKGIALFYLHKYGSAESCVKKAMDIEPQLEEYASIILTQIYLNN